MTGTAPARHRVPGGQFVLHLAVLAGMAALASTYHRAWVPPLLLVALVGYAMVHHVLFGAHRFVVTLDESRLRLGRFGTVPLNRPPTLGLWHQTWTGTSLGTVLYVTTDLNRTLRIGGSGHYLAPDAATGPAATSVEITLPAKAFARILAAHPVGQPATVGAPAAATPPVRVELFDRPGRGSGLWQIVVPILVLQVAGMFFGGCAFAVMLTAGPEAGIVASYAAGVATLAAVGATIWWFGLRRRPSPARFLEFDGRLVTIRDRTGRALATGQPTWQARRYVSGGNRTHPRARHVYPAIMLTLPPERPISVTILNPQYAWSHQVRRSWAPRYLVGEPDWPRLLAALGPIRRSP